MKKTLPKAIGIALFVWLLSQIDRTQLAEQLKQTDPTWFCISFALLMASYALKVYRWHVLLMMTSLPPGLRYAWETYNVGTFLGMVTPGKVGEFGRAAYLKQRGIHATEALMIIIIDRLFDVAIVGVLSLMAAGILFGSRWWQLSLACLAGAVPATFLCVRYARRLQSKQQWIVPLKNLFSHPFRLAILTVVTVLSWVIYCAWAVTLAISIGLNPPMLALVSAVIFAGIVAMLPVAPSGLGTRDAALVWLLAPMQVSSEQSITFSFLMFVSIVLSSLFGAWYWVKGVRKPQENSL